MPRSRGRTKHKKHQHHAERSALGQRLSSIKEQNKKFYTMILGLLIENEGKMSFPISNLNMILSSHRIYVDVQADTVTLLLKDTEDATMGRGSEEFELSGREGDVGGALQQA